MANSLSVLNREFWSNEMQKVLFVENTAVYVANTRLKDQLGGDGDTGNRPILSSPIISTYTPGSDLTDVDLTATNEQLTITTWKAASIYVDDTDMKQNFYGAASESARRMQQQHNNVIEQAVMTEVTNATHTVDAGSVGGSAGSNISLNTDNAPQVFTAAHTKLYSVDAPMGNRIAIIGAHTLETLRLQQAGRPTGLGDQVTQNGIVGPLFGWQIVYNNNLRFSATLTMSTNPSDGDTVTIAGVVFTFRTTQGALAGSVNICSDAAHTVTSFVASINTPQTTVAEVTDAGFNALSGADVLLLQKRGIVATDNTTTIGIVGYGDIVVSETLTAAPNVWSAQLQDSLFLIKGAIDLVVQIPPKVEVTRVEKRFGERVKSLSGYGKKTFADGAREMVRVKFDASAWA